MNPSSRVICLGRTAMDILCVMDGYPRPDTKVKLDAFSLQGGGPAATAAVTLRRLGLATAFVGKVANDMFGAFMVDALSREAVDTGGIVRQADGVSPFACIAVDRRSGDRTILWTDGDVSALESAELDPALLAGARAIHLDGHHLRAAIEAARIVKAGGGTVSFDAGTVRPGAEELSGLCDILIATKTFALELTGAATEREALAALLQRGVAVAGITLGAEGSLISDGARIIERAAYKVDTVDTTGAGDVFHGAFLAAYLLGRDLEGCVELASAAAALKCTRLGGRPGIPDLATADAFIEARRAGR